MNEEREDSGQDRRQTGADRGSLRQRGEDAAVAYLERQGFAIAARNWRCPGGQIDIIAWDGLDIVLVDVTTRRSVPNGSAIGSVSQARAKRLRSISRHWLVANEVCPRQVRFDVITLLVLAEDRALLRHLRNEFTIVA